MRRIVLGLAGLLLTAWAAQAQFVTVTGPVTPGNCPVFASVTVIKDSGSSNCGGGAGGITIGAAITGVCTNGFVIFNNAGVVGCEAAAGTGTVTSVATGQGLKGGTITTAGTLTTSEGVDTNTLRSVVANDTLLNTDCGKTLQLGTGSTGQFTETLPSVSGFATTCKVTVVNGDTGRGKKLSGFPANVGAVLWPLQTVVVEIINGAWAAPQISGRYVTTNATVFVDNGAGNDANDCLASGVGACATSTQAMTNIAKYFDNQGQIVIQWGCASPPCTYANVTFIAQAYVGSGYIILQGDTTTPDNVVMSCTSGSCGSAPGSIFNFIQSNTRTTAGNWFVQGFKITSSVSGINGIFGQGASAWVAFNSIDFGIMNNGSHVACIAPSALQSNGNFTISGNATHFADIEDGCVAHFVNGVGTLTGTPAFTSFLFAHGVSVIGTTASNFSGSATGIKCNSDFNAIIDTAATSASLPGNSACTFSNGGIVF